jgi:hypothetical protein
MGLGFESPLLGKKKKKKGRLGHLFSAYSDQAWYCIKKLDVFFFVIRVCLENISLTNFWWFYFTYFFCFAKQSFNSSN